MRKLIFILIALVSFSQAQTIQYIGAPTTTVISRGNFRTDSIFYLPKRTKTPTDTAAFRYQISDSSLYYWTGYQWTKVQSASSFALVDTTVISTRAYRQKGIDSVQYNVGLKVNITDTSNMLSPYFRKVDTATLSNRINLKLNISDTSTMLSPYARTSDVNASLALKLNISDTSTMLSPYFRKVDTLTLSNRINLKLNISDTSTMLSPYARTSNVNASLATKVNISDTSTMLSPYLRKSDTLTLSNRINLKVNISDTASMLTPYLRKVDTAAMLSPYYRSATATAALATKLNISDTSTMLSPYIRHAGYGLTKSSQALSVDTALMATRLRVGKVVDSLGAIIATKGSGTVTSVATGYGLSGGTITTTGTLIADTALVASRLRLGKVADSLSLVKQNVLTNPVTGTGTTNYVPKFTGTSTIGNSQIFDNGTTVGLGITPSAWVAWRALQNGAFSMANISNVGFLMANAFWDGAYKYINTGAAQVLEINNANEFRFLTASSGTAGNAISFTQAMTLNTGGELLINTTTDAGAYTLQNNGALYNTLGAVLAASSGQVQVGTTSWPTSLIGKSGSRSLIGNEGILILWNEADAAANNVAGLYLGAKGGGTNGSTTIAGGVIKGLAESASSNAGSLTFETNGGAGNVERLRITSNGESLVGTQTDAGNFRLQVSGNTYVSGDMAIGTSTITEKLNVSGTLDIKLEIETKSSGTNANSALRLKSSSEGRWIMQTGNAVSSGLRFYDEVNGLERIRLHSNGGLKFVPQSAAPNAEAGTVYYDSDDNKLKVYNGTTWVDLH